MKRDTTVSTSTSSTEYGNVVIQSLNGILHFEGANPKRNEATVFARMSNAWPSKQR